jgi:cytochrome P450
MSDISTLPLSFLFGDDYAEDPYTLYAGLRAKGPVHRIDFPSGAEAYLIVDYEHGRAALNDPRLSKDTAHSSVPVDGGEFFGGTMLGMDPPDHTRLRGLVSKAFTARRVESLRPHVQEITDGLLDAMEGRSEVDLLDALAVPLPVQVICELLGVPPGDRADFREWTAVLTVPAVTLEARERRRVAASDRRPADPVPWDDPRRPTGEAPPPQHRLDNPRPDVPARQAAGWNVAQPVMVVPFTRPLTRR